MATLVVAAGAVALSLDDGAAHVTTRSVAAILVLWATLLAVAFGLWPRERPQRGALVCGGLLLAFAAFTGLSALWAPGAERAFGEFDRVALYAALFALPVLATRRGDATRWADGLAVAIGVVAALALGQRLLPGVFPEGDIPRLLPSASTRLSYPLGYWNGLAIILGLGVPLLLRLAASHGSAVVRGLAVAPLPALAAAGYLTSSRGGSGVAVIGTLLFLTLTARRLAVLQALLVAAAGAAVLVAVMRSHPALVDGLPGAEAARDEGPGVAAISALVCLTTAVVHGLLAAVAPARLRLSRPVAATVAAAAAIAGLALLVAADPAERFRTFKEPPKAAPTDVVDEHLSSSAGSGRWQFWDAATDQFAENPVAGQGAGTFEAWWAEHGTLDWFVRNAHSLWLETLGELGLIGALLLAGAFAAGLVEGSRRLRGRPDEERSAVAALLAVVVAFVVGMQIDWAWQIPAVAAIGVVSLALLVGPSTARGVRDLRGRPLRFGPRAVVVLVAWAAMLAQAIPMLVANELRSSQDAVAQGDLREAEERAASARAIQPWAASPHLQLALVREQLADLPGARRHAAEAIERDPADWRLRLVDARLATSAGDVPAAVRALREARRLNPRSPVLRRPEGG